MKLRLQTKIRISSGKVRVKNFATRHKEVATLPEKTIRLNAKQQKSSSCDGGYSTEKGAACTRSPKRGTRGHSHFFITELTL